MKKIYAYLNYSGEDMRNRTSKYGIDIGAIGRRCKKTFEGEPKRWMLKERAWLGKFCRLSKDYEMIADTKPEHDIWA